MNRLRFVLVFVATSVLAGCFLKPHELEVRQGNYIEREKINKLSIGMSREQVKYLLGSPLVVDVLKPNQWGYVYLQGSGGDVAREATLIVIFEDGKVTDIDGDYLPEQ
jgi:outer membrane protein assembly factor BamE